MSCHNVLIQGQRFRTVSILSWELCLRQCCGCPNGYNDKATVPEVFDMEYDDKESCSWDYGWYGWTRLTAANKRSFSLVDTGRILGPEGLGLWTPLVRNCIGFAGTNLVRTRNKRLNRGSTRVLSRPPVRSLASNVGRIILVPIVVVRVSVAIYSGSSVFRRRVNCLGGGYWVSPGSCQSVLVLIFTGPRFDPPLKFQYFE